MKKKTTQRQRVFAIMKSGKWYTLEDIRWRILGRFNHIDSETAVSARLRDFRKAKFGGYIMNAKRKTNGKAQWIYQLEVE